MTEAELQAEIRLAVGRVPHARLFRNMVGEGWMGQPLGRDISDRVAKMLGFNPSRLSIIPDARRVPFGLTPSSGDLIGWTTVTVTPDMVGQRVAVFTSGEVKRPDIKKLPEDQQHWHDTVLAAGGRAGMLRSVEDGFALIRVAP